MRSHAIHLGALSLEDLILKKTINKTILKIAVLEWHPGLPGANELIQYNLTIILALHWCHRRGITSNFTSQFMAQSNRYSATQQGKYTFFHYWPSTWSAASLYRGILMWKGPPMTLHRHENYAVLLFVATNKTTKLYITHPLCKISQSFNPCYTEINSGKINRYSHFYDFPTLR